MVESTSYLRCSSLDGMPYINRRDCLKVLFASAATANDATLKARRPNTIVILTDDQGYARLLVQL